MSAGIMMSFPNTWEEFVEQYQIIDSQHEYTNGAELIPVFRVKQWLDHHDDQYREELQYWQRLSSQYERALLLLARGDTK